MKLNLKTIFFILFILTYIPFHVNVFGQESEKGKNTEVITVYEYKEHPITPNDYLFRTVFWGACFVVVVTVIALLRTMVRMEELKSERKPE